MWEFFSNKIVEIFNIMPDWYYSIGFIIYIFSVLFPRIKFRYYLYDFIGYILFWPIWTIIRVISAIAYFAKQN